MRRGTSAWWLKHYGKPCTGCDHVRCYWYPGHTTVVHAGTTPVWQALGAVMASYDYKVPTSYTGSYNCRGITGSRKKWSGHAWPVAIDINAATNPYIRTPSGRTIRWGVDTDMPALMIRDIEAITASGIRALTWGGRWRTIKDAMHFELRVTVEEIAGGVSSPLGTTTKGTDEMSLKQGDTGAAVKRHQEGLQRWNPDALPQSGADSSYGAETTQWVKAYQEAADLPRTGIIDGVTSALLISYTHSSATVAEHGHEATITIGKHIK